MSSSINPESLAPIQDFKYEPLDADNKGKGEFRLLVLQPGEYHDLLRGRLVHESLSPPPKYEALSYAWRQKILLENLNLTHTILIDGYRLGISPNLEAALRRVRRGKTYRILWVDAICINQGDLGERSGQIGIMGQIYSRATRVLAWLGERSKNQVDLAFDTLEELAWVLKASVVQHIADCRKLKFDQILLGNVVATLSEEFNSSESTFWTGCRRYFDNPRISEISDCSSTTLFSSNLSSNMKSLPLKFVFFLDGFNYTPLIIPHGTKNFSDLMARTMGPKGKFAKALTSSQACISDIEDFRERMDVIHKIFHGEYQKRQWVVQELMLASKVLFLCTDRQIQFEALYFANSVLSLLARLEEGNQILSEGLNTQAMLELRNLAWTFENAFDSRDLHLEHRLPITELVQRYFGRLSSEPHDAVYALLPIAAPNSILIDYSIPVADLYIDITRLAIANTRTPNIVCMGVDQVSSSILKCMPYIITPSWVPHFESVLTPGSLYHSYEALDAQHYQAGRSFFDAEICLSEPDHRVMRLDGAFCENIKTMDTTFRLPTLAVDNSGLIEHWLLERRKSRAMPPISRMMHQNEPDKVANIDFFRAIVMDTYWTDSGERAVKRIADARFNSKECFECDIEQALTSTIPERLLSVLRRTLLSKCICCTSADTIALVMGDAEPGDRIFVARGASCPFILRPIVADATYEPAKERNKISTFYKLVGGAYVDGIMDGEVVAKIDSGELKQEAMFLI